MGGMVLETNMTEIMTRIEEQNKLEKSEVGSTGYYHQLTTVACFFFSNRNLNYSFPDLQLTKLKNK